MNYNFYLRNCLMLEIYIIDAISFAYYNLIKSRWFLCRKKLITVTFLCYLTKCILLEVAQAYNHIG
jgi:hypothetical protein